MIWHQLSWQNKREVTVHTLVDTALNKLCLFSKDTLKQQYLSDFLGINKDVIDNFVTLFDISESRTLAYFLLKILKADLLNYLKEQSSQIETFINGCEATIRVRIMDGKVISLNGFHGRSVRLINR